MLPSKDVHILIPGNYYYPMLPGRGRASDIKVADRIIVINQLTLKQTILGHPSIMIPSHGLLYMANAGR